MILDTLAHAERYRALHPLFERAFDFLRDTDLMALAPGKHDVQGEQIFAIVEACEGRMRAEAKLECHRRYIDIQLVLAGVDEMGWKPVAGWGDPGAPNATPRDHRIYNGAHANT